MLNDNHLYLEMTYVELPQVKVAVVCKGPCDREYLMELTHQPWGEACRSGRNIGDSWGQRDMSEINVIKLDNVAKSCTRHPASDENERLRYELGVSGLLMGRELRFPGRIAVRYATR